MADPVPESVSEPVDDAAVVERAIASMPIPPAVGGKLIYAAVAAMLAGIEAIKKDRKATTFSGGGGYNFRGIDDVYNAVNPLLAKVGVFPVAKVLKHEQIERETKTGALQVFTIMHMRYRFFASDGSNIVTEAIGEAADTSDKSTNKAMSVAYKYAMFQLLCIPTEAIDPDATIPPESVPPGKEINKSAKAKPRGGRGQVVEPPTTKDAPVDSAPAFDVASTRKAIGEAKDAGSLMTIERSINQAGMAERIDKATWEQLLFGVLSAAVSHGLTTKRIHNYRDRKMLDADRVSVLEQAIVKRDAAVAAAAKDSDAPTNTEGVASGDQTSSAD